MPEFDWEHIVQAAKEWMAENPDRSPLWLVLPEDTPDGIMEMASDIYDCPVITDDIDAPWFTSVAPAESVPSWDSGPGGSRFSTMRLRELATAGKLTVEDISGLSMTEYAAVRDILLNQVNSAVKGRAAGNVLKDFKKL